MRLKDKIKALNPICCAMRAFVAQSERTRHVIIHHGKDALKSTVIKERELADANRR
jgi:hypothetical protein